ncbi:hypothetical protein ISS05_02840 [Candidatus Woesearchaeota archaeon]|nr:hypothetical protein [Candidatus Woesearchaeota archaeon]
MKLKIFLIISIFVCVVGCQQQSKITNFEECVGAGNPIMESYPKQCRAGEKTFVEGIDKILTPLQKPTITLEEATSIAENSECTEKGSLTKIYMYNENSRTWWIDLEMKPEFKKDICNPACVIHEETKQAEINWRCTGLLT